MKYLYITIIILASFGCAEEHSMAEIIRLTRADELAFVLCRHERKTISVFCKNHSINDSSGQSKLLVIGCDTLGIEINEYPDAFLNSGYSYILDPDGLIHMKPSASGGSCSYLYEFKRTHKDSLYEIRASLNYKNCQDTTVHIISDNKVIRTNLPQSSMWVTKDYEYDHQGQLAVIRKKGRHENEEFDITETTLYSINEDGSMDIEKWLHKQEDNSECLLEAWSVMDRKLTKFVTTNCKETSIIENNNL